MSWGCKTIKEGQYSEHPDELKMQKKGRELFSDKKCRVPRLAGKILYRYSVGNKWLNTSFGEEKKQVLQRISLQRQSNNVTDGQKFISCCAVSSLGLSTATETQVSWREPRKHHQVNKKSTGPWKKLQTWIHLIQRDGNPVIQKGVKRQR